MSKSSARAIGDEQALTEACESFAQDLTQTVRGVLGPSTAEWEALASTLRHGHATVVVRPVPDEGFVLPIGGAQALELKASVGCSWDHRQRYLAVDQSKIAVHTVGVTEPLFRVEFSRQSGKDVPVAHLQVHAHRDEFTWQMLRGQAGRPQARAAARRPPGIRALHFPLGGHRFRPCLEDVLQLLVVEFGVDHARNWRSAVRAGRRDWRSKQLGAAVRDDPEVAAATLKELGYRVRHPSELPEARADRLEAY